MNDNLFFKVLRNVYIRKQILYWIKNQCNGFITLKEPDDSGPVTTKTINTTTYKNYRYSKDYNSITSLEWMIDNNLYPMIIDKLANNNNNNNNYIHITKKSIKKLIINCNNQSVFTHLFKYKRNEIEVFDLIEKSVKLNSVFAFNQFINLYQQDNNDNSKNILDQLIKSNLSIWNSNNECTINSNENCIGQTLLDIAISYGSLEIADYLITIKGLDVYTESQLIKNATCCKKQKVTHRTIRYGNEISEIITNEQMEQTKLKYKKYISKFEKQQTTTKGNKQITIEKEINRQLKLLQFERDLGINYKLQKQQQQKIIFHSFYSNEGPKCTSFFILSGSESTKHKKMTEYHQSNFIPKQQQSFYQKYPTELTFEWIQINLNHTFHSLIEKYKTNGNGCDDCEDGQLFNNSYVDPKHLTNLSIDKQIAIISNKFYIGEYKMGDYHDNKIIDGKDQFNIAIFLFLSKECRNHKCKDKFNHMVKLLQTFKDKTEINDYLVQCIIDGIIDDPTVDHQIIEYLVSSNQLKGLDDYIISTSNNVKVRKLVIDLFSCCWYHFSIEALNIVFKYIDKYPSDKYHFSGILSFQFDNYSRIKIYPHQQIISFFQFISPYFPTMLTSIESIFELLVSLYPIELIEELCLRCLYFKGKFTSWVQKSPFHQMYLFCSPNFSTGKLDTNKIDKYFDMISKCSNVSFSEFVSNLPFFNENLDHTKHEKVELINYLSKIIPIKIPKLFQLLSFIHLIYGLFNSPSTTTTTLDQQIECYKQLDKYKINLILTSQKNYEAISTPSLLKSNFGNYKLNNCFFDSFLINSLFGSGENGTIDTESLLKIIYCVNSINNIESKLLSYKSMGVDLQDIIQVLNFIYTNDLLVDFGNNLILLIFEKLVIKIQDQSILINTFSIIFNSLPKKSILKNGVNSNNELILHLIHLSINNDLYKFYHYLLVNCYKPYLSKSMAQQEQYQIVENYNKFKLKLKSTITSSVVINVDPGDTAFNLLLCGYPTKLIEKAKGEVINSTPYLQWKLDKVARETISSFDFTICKEIFDCFFNKLNNNGKSNFADSIIWYTIKYNRFDLFRYSFNSQNKEYFTSKFSNSSFQKLIKNSQNRFTEFLITNNPLLFNKFIVDCFESDSNLLCLHLLKSGNLSTFKLISSKFQFQFNPSSIHQTTLNQIFASNHLNIITYLNNDLNILFPLCKFLKINNRLLSYGKFKCIISFLMYITFLKLQKQ